MDFQKIAKVNRYIELRNPFPRIENPFSRIAIRSLNFNKNPLSQIAILSLDFNTKQFEGTNFSQRVRCVYFKGTYINARERMVLFEGTNCNPREQIVKIERTNYQFVRTDCTIRYNDLVMAFFENVHVPSGLS